jgi:hypothetical protein
MRTIGIRATPNEVIFAIFDSDANEIINVENIVIPAAMGTPGSLKYLRNNLLDILREYEVSSAGIRITESTARTVSIERVQIEGVIQEAFASSNLLKYYVGQIACISAKLSMDRSDFKKYVAGELNYDVAGWKKHSANEREAILCAIGAVNA